MVIARDWVVLENCDCLQDGRVPRKSCFFFFFTVKHTNGAKHKREVKENGGVMLSLGRVVQYKFV